MSNEVALDGRGEDIPGHRILDGTDLEIAYNFIGDDLVLRVNKGPALVFRVLLQDARKQMPGNQLFNLSTFSPDFVFKIGDSQAGMKRLRSASGSRAGWTGFDWKKDETS